MPRPEVDKLTAWTTVHLHGGHRTPSTTGRRISQSAPGTRSWLSTPTTRRRHLFYHDHAMAVTSLNVAAGLIGNYVVRDAEEDQLGLPNGSYEIPLAIQEVNFDTDAQGRLNGQILSKRIIGSNVELTPGSMPPAFAGLAPFTMVNGVVWPNLDVEAHAYRFRLVNVSGVRVYRLVVVDEETGQVVRGAMKLVGTDMGLLGKPQTVDEAWDCCSGSPTSSLGGRRARSGPRHPVGLPDVVAAPSDAGGPCSAVRPGPGTVDVATAAPARADPRCPGRRRTRLGAARPGHHTSRAPRGRRDGRARPAYSRRIAPKPKLSPAARCPPACPTWRGARASSWTSSTSTRRAPHAATAAVFALNRQTHLPQSEGSIVNSYAIRAASIFDGFDLSGPTTVQITDGRIVSVDRTGAVPTGGGDVLDLGPQSCLLPGLVDTHVHLAFNAGWDPVAALIETDDAELLTQMRAAAQSALRAGITTVRDLGDRSYLALTLAEEFKQQPESGPEILAAGPPLTTPGGHCHFFGGEVEYFGGEVERAKALRAAVRERHARGCAAIKIMASGGNMTPGSVAPHDSQYTLADLRVVVEEAHRLGLPVAAHAHGVAAIKDAVEAGVDSLEHVSFLTANGSNPDPDLLAAVAESDSFVSLTVGLDPRVPLPNNPAMSSQNNARLGAYRDLLKLGARVVVGSDAGIAPFKPHDVLPYGVSDLAQLGISPLDSLASVTSLAAEACGVDGRKGQITVGADADLLAVHGNPAEDPAALLNVQAVFRAGVRIR